MQKPLSWLPWSVARYIPLEHLFEVLPYHLALDLQGRCHLPLGGGEIAREEGEALDPVEGGEVGLQAVDAAPHQVENPRVTDQVAVIEKVDLLEAGVFFEILEIGDQQRGKIGLAVAVNHGVGQDIYRS